MQKKNKIKLNYSYYLEQWKETHDPKWAVELAKMHETNQIGFKLKYDGELKFFPHSKFKNKCDRCKNYYMPGDPCFCLDDEKWCDNCATDEDRELPYYIANKPQHKQYIGKSPVMSIVKEPISTSELFDMEDEDYEETDQYWDDKKVESK